MLGTRPSALSVLDLQRVLALPRRAPLDCEKAEGAYSPAAQALMEYVTAKFARHRGVCGCAALGHACIKMLNPAQAWALREMPRSGGVHGLLGVGSGKTVLGILAPLAFPKCRQTVLLAKPTQRIHYELHWQLLREHFFVPSLVFDDGTAGSIISDPVERRAFAERFGGRTPPVIHFLPYSRLSRPDATDRLDRLSPDLIVADESHCIAGNSVRTGRVKRYLATRETAICDWSGTIVKRSVFDTSYLTTFALGEGSPQPLDPDEAKSWSAVVDPSRMPDWTSSTAKALREAFAPGKTGPAYPVDAVREGMRSRLVETLGVISTRAHIIDCALYVHERQTPPMPEAVKSALKAARGGPDAVPVRPDGEVLVEATDVARVSREVACGFHNYWAFPGPKCECPVPGRTPVCARCARIDDWFTKRKAYNKELRSKLQSAEVHLDSPLLCYNAAERFWRKYDGDLPTWQSETWQAWSTIKDEVPHESRFKWIEAGDFLARDAAAWAAEYRGIVWVKSRALGLKISEIAGIPYLAGGPESERAVRAERGERSIVVSIPAHGESTDGFQWYFNKQLVCELPASGNGFEQLFGRLAREGQKADEIETWVYRHCLEFKEDLRSALKLAKFIEQTTPNRQWLCMADFSFDPWK